MPAATPADLPNRLLPLAGGHNFRDLGGYRTADGQRVRWRVLYRSGKLSALTAEDVAQLATRGIQAVCDLRTGSLQKTEKIVR
jgi:protein-tyrosine phosphatase